MADEARRSIDEIIGSIRSIMDRGGAVANDDVPDDLTDLPDGPTAHAGTVHAEPAYAEPVAPRPIADDLGDAFDVPAPPVAFDRADADRMAQIARAVNGNLEAAARPEDEAPEPEPDGDAIVASFGRRAERPAPTRIRDSEPGVHDRLSALNEVVDETVTMRGVPVRAANDAVPSAASAAAPTESPAPDIALPPASALAVPPPPASAQPHPSDPVLDDATLRPIIREWLDDNLPPLVERLVREELQKAIHGPRRGR